jgi:hypothetical protein
LHNIADICKIQLGILAYTSLAVNGDIGWADSVCKSGPGEVGFADRLEVKFGEKGVGLLNAVWILRG